MLEVCRAFDFVRQEKPPQAHTVLLDRVWPRGLRKEELGVDEWARHLAPSSTLRQWFNCSPERWQEFLCCYREELESAREDELTRMAALSRDAHLILLYGDRDREYNQAVAFRQILEQVSVRSAVD